MRIVQDHPRLAAAAILMASIAINAALYRMATNDLPEAGVAENNFDSAGKSLTEKRAQSATPSVRTEPLTSPELTEQDGWEIGEKAATEAGAGNKDIRINPIPSMPAAKQPARQRIDKNARAHARKTKSQLDNIPSRSNLLLDALPNHKGEPSSAPFPDFEAVL